MRFGRGRFHELVERQLDLFSVDESQLLAEAGAADAAWTNASADASEELYGDFQLVADAVGERLYDMREAFAGTLREPRRRRVPFRLRRGGSEAVRRPRVVSRGRRLMAERIEDYGIIGDLQSIALVGRQGCIDWLCLPRFDSGAIFAALIGTSENGHWTVQPDGDFTSPARRYRGDSLVLETDFETATGAARLIDFMPPRGEAPDVVRIVEGTRGKVEMRMELALRFDYGSIVPWVRSRDGSIVGVAGPDAVSLRTPVDLEGRDLRTYAQFTVEEGARVPFVLTWFPSNRDLPSPVDAELALSQTLDYWGEWMRQCTLEGRWSEAVRRSLITLKALTYAPDGRHRGGPHDVAAGGHRGRSQLGLPLLLAAGRDADASRVRPRRLPRRSAPVA